jgi:putative transposase
MFAEGTPVPKLAAVLEVSTKAAYGWRRARLAGGVQALASKSRPGPARRLSDSQVDRLERRLEQGAAAAGGVCRSLAWCATGPATTAG